MQKQNLAFRRTCYIPRFNFTTFTSTLFVIMFFSLISYLHNFTACLFSCLVNTGTELAILSHQMQIQTPPPFSLQKQYTKPWHQLYDSLLASFAVRNPFETGIFRNSFLRVFPDCAPRYLCLGQLSHSVRPSSATGCEIGGTFSGTRVCQAAQLMVFIGVLFNGFKENTLIAQNIRRKPTYHTYSRLIRTRSIIITKVYQSNRRTYFMYTNTYINIVFSVSPVKNTIFTIAQRLSET